MPADAFEGAGHPLLFKQLLKFSAIKYPASLQAAPMGSLKDEAGNTYLVRPDGYQFEKLFVDPSQPPSGRNDPVYAAWYTDAIGKARARFWADNDAIYQANNWNNGQFVIGQFPDVDALELWAKLNGTTLAQLAAQGVTPKLVREADPSLDHTRPHYYPGTTPFILVGAGDAWASQDYEGLALHNPKDDGRDQVAGVRAPMPAATVEFLRKAYHLAATFGHDINLTTLDGKAPAFLLTVNRWSRLAYIQGTNIVTLPGREVSVLQAIQNAKTGDIAGEVSSIVEIFSALGGGNIKGLADQGDIIKGAIGDQGGKLDAPAPPPTAPAKGPSGVLIAVILFLLFKVVF